MQPTRNWWTYYENPIYLFPDPTIYALRGIIDLEKVPIEIFKILSSSQVLLCHGREHQLVLDIFHSQLFMLIPAYRLLGWWSIDEGSREEQARLYCAEAPGSVFTTTI